MVWDHNTARLAHETRIIWDGCAQNDLKQELSGMVVQKMI
jgi:hypothetical protein